MNLREPLNLIVTPKNSGEFIYKIADVTLSQGSLTLLSAKLYKESKIHIPHQSNRSANYSFLTFYRCDNKADYLPTFKISAQETTETSHVNPTEDITPPPKTDQHIVHSTTKCFLTTEHYRGAIMIKKKQDLMKVARLCGIPEEGRVEDLKALLIHHIESQLGHYVNFRLKADITDELTKHLNKVTIEEELHQFGVIPKGSVKDMRTLLSKLIKSNGISVEDSTKERSTDVRQSDQNNNNVDNKPLHNENMITTPLIRKKDADRNKEKELEKKFKSWKTLFLNYKKNLLPRKSCLYNSSKRNLKATKQAHTPINLP